MPLPDHIGYADLYEVAPTSAIDRSGVRPLNEWTQMILDISTDISDETLVTATGGETRTLADWMASIDGIAEADGSPQYLFHPTEGQALDLRYATDAAPDTGYNPVVKVTRTMGVPDNGEGGDHAEEFAAITGIAVGTPSMVGQPIGVLGIAKNNGTVNGTGGSRNCDAVGVFGHGHVGAASTRVGIGAYIEGMRFGPNGLATGVEVKTANYGGANGSYVSNGYSVGMGVFICPDGDYDSGAGVVIGHAFSPQFSVGFAIPGWIANGKTGGVKDSSFRDDGNATISLEIRGSHSYGLDLRNGTFGQAALRLGNNQIVKARNAAGDADHNILQYNTSNLLVVGTDASAVYIATNLTMAEGINIVAGTSSGLKIGTATTQKLGFFNSTPIVQQTVGAGLSTGGAETNTNICTRINQIRNALINFGFVV